MYVPGRETRLPSAALLVGWAMAVLGGAALMAPRHPWAGPLGILAIAGSAILIFRRGGAEGPPPGGGPPGPWEGAGASALLVQLREGLVLLDPALRVLGFNPAARTLLGPSSLLEAGASAAEVFREPESIRNLEQCAAGIPAEWTLHRDPRVLRIRALPLEDAPGKGQVLLTVDDFTRLEALESTRQKFISNASHELKTPVTSIRIAAEGLLESGEIPPEGAEGLRSILRSVDRMTLLLNDISELSRIETGALRLEPREVLLADFLADLERGLQPAAADKKIRLTVESESSLSGHRMRVDLHRLHQLLDNLLGNAVKFSPRGGKVSLRVAPEGPWLRWEVADEGPGIAENEQKRIFERFYRSPSVRGVPGTGLGLSIVKHLVWQMGGEIQVESELGRGSTFTLRLPG
ncbi:MAG: hypothetical protein HY823_11655 [Acidobacteria bacterium]|nr:hypothetical protein [Acidobacteriota bacterium]